MKIENLKIKQRVLTPYGLGVITEINKSNNTVEVSHDNCDEYAYDKYSSYHVDALITLRKSD